MDARTIGTLICLLIYPYLSESYNICRADTLFCKDRVADAIRNYPKDKSALMCVMKIAFIEPNAAHPTYTSCVNTVREQTIGYMLRGGTFNIQNLARMEIALHNEPFRKSIAACLNYLVDCYDVGNLSNCIIHHERL